MFGVKVDVFDERINPIPTRVYIAISLCRAGMADQRHVTFDLDEGSHQHAGNKPYSLGDIQLSVARPSDWTPTRETSLVHFRDT